MSQSSFGKCVWLTRLSGSGKTTITVITNRIIANRL